MNPFPRIAFWIAVYVLALGILSIRIEYTDGLTVNFRGWPDAILEKLSRR